MPQTSSHIAFSWLLNLRWGALFTQLILILAVDLFFDVKTPIVILSVIIAFSAVSNIFFHILVKRKSTISARLTALVMFLDVVLLSLLLVQTGGPMNPFTFLYLIHIALGAILLPALWSWALAVITIFCYASLFFWQDIVCLLGLSLQNIPQSCHSSEPVSGSPGDSDGLFLHLQGMWVAFSITAIYIVFFIGRIQKALARHQEMLADLKDEKIKNEKLAALATLSAGAAHEFATPLSIIAVAAGEMLLHIKEIKGDNELISDAILIREQVDRCKEILYQLAADAGEPLGESTEAFKLDSLWNEILSSFPTEMRDRVEISDSTGTLLFKMPFRTIKRTIKGLIKNAFDATPLNSPLLIRCFMDQFFLYIEIVDQGVGMDEETVAKACEPFFTTKETGKGMGLGLFLAKTVAERFGGTLLIDSTEGKGTRIVLSLALTHVGCSEQ
ncbi:MAG: hypothetical protein A2511_03175 [Deltaproteobacteria bacterium RIFOXYD12_FULL_50_9]|nr:MAG: hypothetical protein A2511_03175 [Deltaproteobacteria bacterium RIFOXYD12_FULL_50_9]